MTTNLDDRAELLTSDSELEETVIEIGTAARREKTTRTTYSGKRKALAEHLSELPRIPVPNRLLSSLVFDALFVFVLGCGLITVGGSIAFLILRVAQLLAGGDGP